VTLCLARRIAHRVRDPENPVLDFKSRTIVGDPAEHSRAQADVAGAGSGYVAEIAVRPYSTLEVAGTAVTYRMTVGAKHLQAGVVHER